MFRKLFKILSLVMLLVMSVSCVALADVPDPYGRPGRRPRPMPEPINAYWVQREGHFYNYSQDKVAVELFYRAVKDTEIRYKLLDGQGNTVMEGTDICKEGFGTILLEMAKPEKGKALEYSYESSCYQTTINTSFGLKKLAEPKLKGSWNCSFVVKAEDNGELDIQTVKASDN